MTTLREKIENIFHHHGIYGEVDKGLVPDILLAIKEEMPDNFVGDLPASIGWNACRKEMERRLG